MRCQSMSSRNNRAWRHKTYANVVRELLLEKWDPINVGDNPNLADEYDTVVPEVVKVLMQGSNEEAFVAVLTTFENKLDSHTPASRKRETARALLNLRLDSPIS